jgi:protein disulfide-isomerase A6
MLDAKGFKNAMKENRTSMVAFVAPWCGHCQKMAPEYSRSALGLYPLIPVYAVDCDAKSNKRLCADQGVTGFPTIKLFPRGKKAPSILYEGERTSSGFFYFAQRRIPNKIRQLHIYEDILNWVAQKVDRPRLVLLTKEKKIPMLWQVLDNRYQDHFAFGSLLDRKGKVSVKMGYEAGSKKEGKVLLYPAGSKQPIRYEGINKHEPLTKFLDSVLDGTVDLKEANEQAKAEEDVVSPEDIEVERKQEAERIALAHGGFADLIDFKKAVKDASARGGSFHGMDIGNLEELMKSQAHPDSEAAVAKEEPVVVVEQLVVEVPHTEPPVAPTGEPLKDEL